MGIPRSQIGIIAVPIIIFLHALSAFAGQLDELYAPLVEKGRVYSRSAFSFFSLIEEGIHGHMSFAEFESEPDYQTLRETLTFSPLEKWEVRIGYGKDFNADYSRPTYNPSGNISFYNKHDLDFLHHFDFGLRRRFDRSELYVEGYGNKGKSSWNSAPGFVEPDFFTTIRSHYENTKLGWRFISDSEDKAALTDLSYLTRSLLHQGQLNLESSIEYKRGKVWRHNKFYGTSPATLRNYTHDLQPHFIPNFGLKYGINDKTELISGLTYELPHRFKYEFQQFNPSGTTNFIIANYKVEKKVSVPLGVMFRPLANLEIALSSDTVYGAQRLEGYEKEPIPDSTTVFPKKRLRYVQTKPTLDLTYLLNPKEGKEKSDINQYTIRLLDRNQLLVKMKYFRDITHLRKNASNGAVNILDAETIFKYPLDNFLAGSEYAAFLTGNSSSTTPDVFPQNFHRAELNFNYGLGSTFNVGIGGGFQSRSGVHQHVFSNDISSRQFQFEPYNFYNVTADWQFSKNSLLTFRLHYVPQYKTFMITDVPAHIKSFEVATEYVKTEAAFHFLF